VSVLIYLIRFDLSGKDVPKYPEVLKDMERLARQLTKQSGNTAAVSTAPDGDSFDIDLPGGTATIHPAWGQFPIEELDPLTLKVMFEIARAGDMVIVADGERAILTDPVQRDHLPAEGWLGGDQISTCFSAEEVGRLLSGWYARQAAFKEQAIAEWRQQPGKQTSIPGTSRASPASFVYVEARPKETAGKHQKKVYNHNKNVLERNGAGLNPKSGLLMSEFWRLETPAGLVFFAYGFGGDKEAWLALLRDFAAAEDRAFGCIENSDTFVQDDGRRFPLATCKCMEVKE